MLQNIREHIQGWFAGVVIALIALSFVLFGIESYLKAENPNLATVAVVNGDKITAQQLQERYHRLLDQIPNANALSEKVRQQIQQQALTQLVNEQALLQLARAMNLAVSVDELRATIASMPAFQEEGRFSALRFNQVLMANHLTEQQFEQQVQQMLLLNQLRNAIQNTAFALPSEVQQSYALLEQKRDLAYFIIAAKKTALNFHPTEEKIQEYYNKHQAEFVRPEELSIQYIELSPTQLAKQINLSQTAVQDYYQQHLNNFPKAKNFKDLEPQLIKLLRQEKTEQLLAEKSEELANLSFTHPDSLEPIAKALKLPIQKTVLFTHKGLPTGLLSEPKVVEAAFSREVLEQGDNSNPIELQEGSLIVLRVDQHKAAAAQALSELRALIVERLANQEAQKNAARLAKKIAKSLNDGVPAAQLAQEYQLSWLTRDGVSATDAHLPHALLKAAFAAPLADAKHSKARWLALPSGDYAVLEVLAQQWGPSAHLSKAQQKAWLDQMAAHQAQIEYQLYERGVIKAAKIEIKALKLPNE